MAEQLTKKQLKEFRKLEKIKSRNLEQKNNTFKWITISVISLLFLVFFVGVVLVAKDKNKPKTTDGSVYFEDNGHIRMISSGNTDSTSSAEKSQEIITLIEYADLQCPACKSYHPITKELLAAFPDRLRLVFKNFPLNSIHPNAMDAAVAAEAVNKQGKYFEYIDLLYEKQEEWAPLADVTKKFEEYAKSVGVDVEQFKKDIKDPSISKLIEDHRSEGITNGVASAPTFFVDGERIQNPSNIEEFKKIISSKLKTAAPTSQPSPIDSSGKLPLQQ